MTSPTTNVAPINCRSSAVQLPLLCHLGLIPLVWISPMLVGGRDRDAGGHMVLFSIMTRSAGCHLDNADPDASDDDLFWYAWNYEAAWMLWHSSNVCLGSVWYVPAGPHPAPSAGRRRGFSSGWASSPANHRDPMPELMARTRTSAKRFSAADAAAGVVLYSHFGPKHVAGAPPLCSHPRVR